MDKKEKQVAYIGIKRKGEAWQISGNWTDANGESYDLGYVVLPTGVGISKGTDVILSQFERTLQGKGVLAKKKDAQK
jgi:hypothetical protein